MQDIATEVTLFLQRYISPELVVFVISMLPILELRGGLIAAALLDIDWLPATLLTAAGNILPIPFILLFIKKILAWLKTTPLFKGVASHFESKAATKGAELIAKYPTRILVGLWLFVGIPLPMTGAWTGALIAAFLGLPIRRSLPVILLGICTASAIMSVFTYLIPSLIAG